MQRGERAWTVPSEQLSRDFFVFQRTFTRKDGTHIDRENILMALSDLDTLLIKINPIGGRRNAVYVVTLRFFSSLACTSAFLLVVFAVLH